MEEICLSCLRKRQCPLGRKWLYSPEEEWENLPDGCEHFLDEDLFLSIPLKVGTKVWVVYGHTIIEAKVSFYSIIVTTNAYLGEKTMYVATINRQIPFVVAGDGYFNETMLLFETKEEAERYVEGKK